MLPKSLQTVRILAAVGRLFVPAHSGDALGAVLEAARVIGYADATSADALIASAVAALDKAPRARAGS